MRFLFFAGMGQSHHPGAAGIAVLFLPLIQVRACIAMKKFFSSNSDPQRKSVRVRNTRIFPFLECETSVADILSGRPERVSAKKEPPPSHSGLKFWLVTTLRATRSLRSLKQALRLTPPAGISPFGHRPPFQWAGSCTSADLFLFRQCGGTCISICLIYFAQVQVRYFPSFSF